MKKYLIINADDFALSKEVNQGIMFAFHKSIVTSTSILANGKAFDDALVQVKNNPNLDIGVHLNILRGRPLSKLSYLIDANGLLQANIFVFVLKCMFNKRRAKNEIYQEFEAQIKKIKNTGLRISHLDTEKHVHVIPFIAEIVIELAHKYNITFVRYPFEKNYIKKVKFIQFFKIFISNTFFYHTKKIFVNSSIKYPDFFHGISLSGEYSIDKLKSLIDRIEPGINELSCHPGFRSKDYTSYIDRYRQSELDVLTNNAFLEYIRMKGVIISNFNYFKN